MKYKRSRIALYFVSKCRQHILLANVEEIIILSLADYGILAERKEGMTGVWVEDEKICAMGVRLSRWVSMHGFAINLRPNMKYYDGMIPCGIQEFGITSLYDLLLKEIDIYEVMENITTNFLEIFKVED